jgi:hypothetical protein
MKAIRLLLCLCFGLFFSGAFASVPGDQKPPPKDADALSRAADEFKSLTRTLGMRPESPTKAQEQNISKAWHGRVYENFRNDVLDAIPHEVRQNNGDKSPLRRNQFGFNVAGPLLIPHVITNPKSLFFLVSYEGVRERISRASLHTIPTALQRTGDFSQTVDQAGNLLPIFDPEGTAPNPAYDATLPVSTSNLQYLREQFPGNRIPADQLAPNVQQALSLYPMPNTNVGPFNQNNYFVNAPETNTADGLIAKFDHDFRERHRLTSLTTFSKGLLGTVKYFPTIASPNAPDEHFDSKRTELDYVFTASPRTINSASFTLESEDTQSGNSSQTPFPRYQLLDSYLSMGTAYPNSRNARNTFTFRDDFSTRVGRHSLGLTFHAEHQQVNSFSPSYPSGRAQFSSGLTSLPGIIDTGDPFASFLLGLPQYGERSITTSPSYFRNSSASVSASDKYSLASHLTLSVGLSLSRRTPRVEKYDRQSTVDPAVINPSNGRPGALVFAGLDGVSRGLRPANVDLDPSAGLSWNPFGNVKNVVRASFSRTHEAIPIYDGQWGTQGFNARQTFISANTQLSPAFDFTAGIPPYTQPLPDLSPSAADNTIADFVDLSGREAVHESASLSAEREIPFSMMVSVGASFSRGWNVLVGDSATNPNAIDPAFLRYGNSLYDETFRTTLQPYPQFKGFELYSLYPAGRYQRTSGYLRLEKRASFGLSFIAYYELSRQYDDYSGPYGNQDLINLHNNWALTSNNPPQYLQLSYIYELPFGQNKPLFHFSGWQGSLISGLTLSGTAYWNDGTPLALHPEFNNTGGVLPTLYVNTVPGIDPRVASPGPSLWFNPAAFDQPPDFTMGNAPRTMPNLLQPGYNAMDLSLNKRMLLSGGRALDFGAEAFNMLNHANWNYADTGIGPTSAPNVNAGRIIGSHGGRVIQLGVKFTF